jgi:hypothetical protein
MLSSVSSAIRGILGDSTRIEGSGNQFEWGTFAKWSHGSFDIPTVVVRRGGSGNVEPNGTVKRPPSNRNMCQQLLVKTKAGSGQDEVLVVWRPETSSQSARITADPDSAANRSGSACMARCQHPDPVTASLFSYVRAGALNQARHSVTVLTNLLDQPGAREDFGSDQATLAAYILYKLRQPKAGATIAYLADKFSDVADLQVVRGAQLISEGKAEDAGQHFQAALNHGMPSYTEGVRMLRDGLNYLRGLYPRDVGIESNARIANSLASAANFNSELTCLRLGRDVAAEFITG